MLHQAQIRPRIACDHLPADTRQRPPCVEVFQRKGRCSVRSLAKTHSAHVERPVSAQMLRLLGDEWLGHPEEVMAENRHLAQMFPSTDGVQNGVPRLDG